MHFILEVLSIFTVIRLEYNILKKYQFKKSVATIFNYTNEFQVIISLTVWLNVS